MSVKQLEQVEVEQRQAGGGWVIQMTFQDADAKRFADLTARAAPRQSPQNQVAIVLGDRLISAPAVAEAISGGQVEIAGNFTEASAKELAEDLGAR